MCRCFVDTPAGMFYAEDTGAEVSDELLPSDEQLLAAAVVAANRMTV